METPRFSVFFSEYDLLTSILSHLNPFKTVEHHFLKMFLTVFYYPVLGVQHCSFHVSEVVSCLLSFLLTFFVYHMHTAYPTFFSSRDLMTLTYWLKLNTNNYSRPNNINQFLLGFVATLWRIIYLLFFLVTLDSINLDTKKENVAVFYNSEEGLCIFFCIVLCIQSFCTRQTPVI
jgi:hypothetical protein